MPRVRQAGHPDNCICCIAPLPAQQGLEELSFLKSACAAAKSGNLEKLRKCIDANRDCVNSDGSEGDSGYTPLIYAAREGHVEAAALLLRHGADPNRQTKAGGSSALHRAAFMGHLAMTELLLDHGAQAVMQDADGQTPLHKAVAQGHEAVAQALLKAAPQALQMRNCHGQAPRQCVAGAEVCAAVIDAATHHAAG